VNVPTINRMITADGDFTPNPRLDQSAGELLDELSGWAIDLAAAGRAG
jgi:hypothetical protein